ncbi:MAG: hypothetical protein JSV63_01600 [Candidatus Aenigmatarchaeota archaeon]|nr:MAG: hypothetical protein JSV63_01600 [Candidatus Aenigmarchaeota archaeon]
MAEKKTAIEVIDEAEEKKKKGKVNECPLCGAPGGKVKCKKCGWSMDEDLGPDYDPEEGDPVLAMQRSERTLKKTKEEFRNLREQNRALMINNQRFSELVERMETQAKILRAEAGKKYVYSYTGGGWGQLGDIDPRKLHINIKKKTISVQDINRQLEEITKLLKRYKK